MAMVEDLIRSEQGLVMPRRANVVDAGDVFRHQDSHDPRGGERLVSVAPRDAGARVLRAHRPRLQHGPPLGKVVHVLRGAAHMSPRALVVQGTGGVGGGQGVSRGELQRAVHRYALLAGGKLLPQAHDQAAAVRRAAAHVIINIGYVSRSIN